MLPPSLRLAVGACKLREERSPKFAELGSALGCQKWAAQPMPLRCRRRRGRRLARLRRSAFDRDDSSPNMAPKRRASEPDVFQLEEEKKPEEKLNLLDGVALKRALDDAVIQVRLGAQRRPGPQRVCRQALTARLLPCRRRSPMRGTQ